MTDVRITDISVIDSNKASEKIVIDKLEASSVLNGETPLKPESTSSEEGISWLMATFLLVNASLGTGILNYPYSYDKAGGIYFATFMQLIVIAVLIFTMIILAHCSDFSGCDTFHEVLRTACGPKAEHCAAISILITCYGISITFLIIIGDQYNRLFLSLIGPNFCDKWYLSRPFTVVLTTLLLIAPICFFKKINFLGYLGAIGTFSMFYTIFLAVYEYIIVDATKGQLKTYPTDIVQMFNSFPVFAFAYQTHEIVVPVYASLKKRNLKEFSKISAFTMMLLFLCYSTEGTFGYLHFGTAVAPDIIAGYGANDPLVLIALVTLAIKMVSTYPQALFCGRGAFDGLYSTLTKKSAEEMLKDEKRRRIIMTTVWLISSAAVGAFVPNISIVIQLLGSLAAANTFIFPGLCLFYLQIRKKVKKNGRKAFCRKFLMVSAVLIIVIGVCMFVVIFFEVLIGSFIGNEEIKDNAFIVGNCT